MRTAVRSDYLQYILDTSDINNIKKLAVISISRLDNLGKTKFKDNDYIIVTSDLYFHIIDYNNGETSSLSLDPLKGEFFFQEIGENYALGTSLHHIAIIDFKDRKSPTATYITRNQEYSYTFSSDQSKVLVKDNEGTLIKEISLFNIEPAKKAIDAWLDNEVYYSSSLVDKPILFSNDYTRAVVTQSSKEYSGPSNTILDISDLSNIKKLGGLGSDHYGVVGIAKIKDDDYIILTTDRKFTIFDYTSGEKIGELSFDVPLTHNDGVISSIEENRATLTYNSYSSSTIIDFRDRTNPIMIER
jgi:hypothetical protein